MTRQYRLLLALTLCVFSIPALAQREAPASPKPVVGRSMVATRYGIVAASQPLAARAGVQILERGGNAIDAAIAANATIGLMEPTGNGLGGDLFAIIYEAKTGKVLRAQRERLGADRTDRRHSSPARASRRCRSAASTR